MKIKTQTHTDIDKNAQEKLEWQEPSFEHLNNPEGGPFVGATEDTTFRVS